MGNRRRILRIIGGVVVILGIIAFLWFVPHLQGGNFFQDVPTKELPALVNEYRRTWAQIIGGIVLIVGLYATWRRVEISQQTLEAAQDQQVTERFTRAIDQLGATYDTTGAPRLEIRLGGIYALERIARDSPERDYGIVMEVLTAYVREQAPWPPASSAPNPMFTEASPPLPQKRAARTPYKPRTDIQAILNVLGRREEKHVPREHRVRLDLRRTDLRGAHLEGNHLEKAYLFEAHLEEAHLAGTHLEEANLVTAHLEGARLVRTHLEEANLAGACLEGAHLYRSSLSKAIGLTQEQIDAAHGDDETVLPEGLERPAHWSKSTGEQPASEK